MAKRKLREQAQEHWYKIPRKIRRPLVILVGFVFILLSGLTGWLPGPGGIPLFLIGIMVLATEYSWAERFRDFILKLLKISGEFIKKHHFISAFFFACGVTIVVYGMYYLFIR